MSLKKDHIQSSGGLRVAADDPHLVSLGNGRLSTAVTIHPIHIGDTKIGSSSECSVILNGSGVHPLHCTLYRSEENEITLVPRKNSRILIDGKKIDDETNLSQGAMLTIGKSNYLRFNNPAEAQMIRSTIGSNERISMPQIDFAQDSSSSNEGGCSTPDDVFKSLTDMLDTQTGTHNNNSNNLLHNNFNNKPSEYASTMNNYHSPKVFAADSITVNAPAKDVLGPKFNNFTKNLTNLFTKNDKNLDGTRHNNDLHVPPTRSIETNVLTVKVNNATANCITNGSGGSNSSSVKLQPASACYDRYPKPGSYGSLQVFPMNGVNTEINTGVTKDTLAIEVQRQRAQIERMQEEEMSMAEQDRLEEILKMCADFERQNSSVQSSPIVQNRIKTNGSLPRDKKSSPYVDLAAQNHSNVFFPSSPSEIRHHNSASSSSTTAATPSNGYENVKLTPGRRVELATSPSSRYENFSQQLSLASPEADAYQHLNGAGKSTTASSNGYENVSIMARRSPVGYVPQSPRTRIKTCISPKKEMTSTPVQRKTEYDLLVQSFEEKLRMEIQHLRHQNGNGHGKASSLPPLHPPPPLPSHPTSSSSTTSTMHAKQMNGGAPEGIYGQLTTVKNKNINNLTVNIKKNLDENQIAILKRQRIEVLKNVRDLKASIAELQRQEEEVLRELDLEKALVTAELSTEQKYLADMELNLSTLQTKIHRMEAQRNANRVLQETQQNKLKQSIDMKQNQVDGLEKIIGENGSSGGGDDDDALKEELTQTIALLENDTKTFEDLEFQYLEEETEWLAYREELHSEQKMLKLRIEEKRAHIDALEMQGIDNQNTACVDTKNIEKDLFALLNDLEKCREELKTIDTLLFELSGQKNAVPSDSDDDFSSLQSGANHKDIMSQSLFGSQEILAGAKQHNTVDVMSKSLNENLFSNKIETLPFADANDAFKNCLNGERPKVNPASSSNSTDSANRHSSGSGSSTSPNASDSPSSSSAGSGIARADPLQKLKYNLSPPFDHKNGEENHKTANLNLSIESDDFEVNPLEKRVPSQDDIDRICKVTLDAPISTQGASYKVIESIKEIERNRQLLLAQQGSHVIEHERQKMNELKKKSHDEARAQYLQLQNHVDDTSSYRNKVGSLENLDTGNARDDHQQEKREHSLPIQINFKPNKENVSSPQRHSHPDLDRERPLSQANSEISYDALSDKPFKSSSDIRSSTHRMHDRDDNGSGSQRGSIMSSENSESGRMVAGNKRNLPKHQRPLTRYLPIMSADLDLRLHIESAGHQVNLCPHIIVDSFSCRGYLHKLGATFHGWSRRWFVLDRQKMALIYYSDKSERKPRGGAYFSTIDEVYLDHLNTSKSGRPHCTFIVKTKRRSYHLQAASDATARIWIDAIITGAQGNIDY